MSEHTPVTGHGHNEHHENHPQENHSQENKVSRFKGGIASRIGQLLYGNTQNNNDGTLRSDKTNFIRALISSYFPGIGVIPVLWFTGEVNQQAANYARNVNGVSDFEKDIVADRKSVEAALVSIAANGSITYTLSRLVFDSFITEPDISFFLSSGVTGVNLLQAYLVLRLARADHQATATSGGQKLKDLPADQAFREANGH